jgi:hypothetical protein
MNLLGFFMFSSESFILLTVQLIKLKFFKSEQLNTINDITEILISKNVKPPSFWLYPWYALIYALKGLELFICFLIGAFLVVAFFEGDPTPLSTIFNLISSYRIFPIFGGAVILVSLIMIKIIDHFIKQKILTLKAENFNTTTYIEKLHDILEPYSSLKIIQLLKDNQSNLFGLVLLQFILVCIEKDYIKHADLYLKPFTFLRKSI